MLIAVMEMELNVESSDTFDVTLAHDVPGIGNAGDKITMLLNSSNVDRVLGAGSPAASAVKELIQSMPKSYSMSGTIKMDAKDHEALLDALSNLSQKAPLPVIDVTGGPTMCECGHPYGDHNDFATEPCKLCDCEGFRQ